jgi:hypothetical protein
MATAAEIAASMNSIFGDDGPADKKGGLLSRIMPAEGTHVTTQTVIAAYPVVIAKATLLLRTRKAAAEHRACDVGLWMAAIGTFRT